MKCKKQFRDRKAEYRHYSHNHQNGDYPCPLDGCGSRFKYRKDLESHKRIGHDNFGLNNLVQCNYEGCYNIYRLKYMQKHIECVHFEVCEHQCYWPGCKMIVTKQELHQHIANHQNKDIEDSDQTDVDEDSCDSSSSIDKTISSRRTRRSARRQAENSSNSIELTSENESVSNDRTTSNSRKRIRQAARIAEINSTNDPAAIPPTMQQDSTDSTKGSHTPSLDNLFKKLTCPSFNPDFPYQCAFENCGRNFKSEFV